VKDQNLNILHSWSVGNILWSRKSLFYKNSKPILTKLETFRITNNSIIYSSDDTRNVFNKTLKPQKSSNNDLLMFNKVLYTYFIYLNKFLSKNMETSSYTDSSYQLKSKVLNNFQTCQNFNLTTSKFFWLTKNILKNKLNNFLKKIGKNRYKIFKNKKLPKISIKLPYLKLKTFYGFRKKYKSKLRKSVVNFLKKSKKSKNYLLKDLSSVKRNVSWKIFKTKFNFFRSLNVINKNRKLEIQNYFNSNNVTNLKLKNKLSLLNVNVFNYAKNYSNNLISFKTNFSVFFKSENFNNMNIFAFYLKNPILLKLEKLNFYNSANNKIKLLLNKILVNDMILSQKMGFFKNNELIKNLSHTNLTPHKTFKYVLSKKIYSTNNSQAIKTDVIPWYHHTLIRFIENCSGRKVFFQFYPFVNQEVGKDFIVRYKKWMPRMSFYERRLGHKFFLEEALHILHIGFILKDPVLLCNWLKAMILRISFWKTKSIFRFLKYLLHNYYKFIFEDLGIKGLKLKLKGKISAAGNSRKRTILYRIGETSHSTIDLRVAYDSKVITTFTGAMGFQIWLFY